MVWRTGGDVGDYGAMCRARGKFEKRRLNLGTGVKVGNEGRKAGDGEIRG